MGDDIIDVGYIVTLGPFLAHAADGGGIEQVRGAACRRGPAARASHARFRV
jgi:hypothetical protein